MMENDDWLWCIWTKFWLDEDVEDTPKLKRALIIYLPLWEILHCVIQLRHICHSCCRLTPVLVLRETHWWWVDQGWMCSTCGRIWTSMTSCCSSLSSGRLTVVSQVVFNRAAPDTLELGGKDSCIVSTVQYEKYKMSKRLRRWPEKSPFGEVDTLLSWIWRGGWGS